MTQDSVKEPPIVTISESVADRLREAAQNANVEDVVVRFSLQEEQGGIAHKIGLERSTGPGDIVFEQYGLTMVVEPQQAPMLTGAHFDYTEVDGRAQLTVANPNLSM